MKGLLVLAFVIARIACAAEGLPEWAYGIDHASANPPPAPLVADQSPKHLAGSSLSFTHAEIYNFFGPADWYPGDHPVMPAIVSRGKKPEVWACALCHYPNGKGRPENAGVAGLPVSYFIHQMTDFRDGLRQSSDEHKRNTELMIAYGKAMTDEEIRQAAEYFGAIKWTPWIRVIETETVPKTRVSVGMFLPVEGGGREPIGRRIIETPENPEAAEELRDPRSGFIAYVPKGSVAKGKALVQAGACGACHGDALKGLGPVPGIAGRSPSYVARRMYDMKTGARKGEWAALMAPVVSRLTSDDLINIAAYTASLAP